VAAAAIAAPAVASDVAYVTTIGSGVFAYDVNPASGSLAQVQGSPFPAGNDGFGVTATPDRRHLYVSNYEDNTLSVFEIAASGALSPAGSPVATPHPVLSATTPDGRFLYVANDGSPGSVSGFAVSRSSGALSPVPGSPVAATDPGPFGPVVSPDGRYLYVSNVGNSPASPGSVSAYRIDQDTGALTEIGGSPYTLQIAPGGVAMTPDGRLLYVANGESGTISAFTRDADSGALTPVSGSPFAAGNGEPTGLAITPDGRHLYSANSSMVTQADNQVHAFAIDQGTDALAEISGSPYDAGLGPQYAAISSDGAHLYVTNNGSQDITGYAIDATSGGLSPLGESPFATGMNPLGITIPRPSNEFSFGKLRKLKRKGKARLTLELAGPGKVELAGKRVKRRTKHPEGTKQRLSVAPTGEAKRKLRKRGKAKLKVEATYTPEGGTPSTKSKRIRVIRR
jgi:6-phosphogluconolactonase